MKESDDWMIKIIYFAERELVVKREIETKAPKDTEAKVTEVIHPYTGERKFEFNSGMLIRKSIKPKLMLKTMEGKF